MITINKITKYLFFTVKQFEDAMNSAKFNKVQPFYYAVFSLRDADIFFRDGSVLTATTTLSASALKGALTVTVTSATGILVGQAIVINNSLEYYVVTGLSGSTLTITPALTMNMPSSSPVANVANALEVHLGDGTLTYNEKRGVTYVLNRGRIYTVKLADDAPVEVNMGFIWEFLRAPVGEPPTIEEAIKQIGAAVGWVSSSADPCEPYAVDIVICWSPPCGDAERVTLQDFRWESLNHDTKAGQVTVTGNCNIPFATVEHGSS
jgi:hypothetical protein